MGSSWAFKTTASLIKPTREALLDYCSYVLIVIALVGTARIIIGRKDLEQLCAGSNAIENKSIKEHNNHTHNASSTSFADQSKHGIDEGFKFESNLKVHISNQISKTIDIEEDSTSMPAPKHYCLKHYQAYLPYFLLVESIVLLLIGVLWVKMPAVQQLVKQFANILHECRQSTWYISVADVLRSPSTMPVTQSLFTLMKSDAVNMEIVLLLETLFRPESAYLNKSQARKLYEQVQKFCNETEKSTALLNSYMTKSLAQLISWMVFFFVNMVLFVKYEFYSGCNLSEPFCDHDTFLRIIWFLAQLIVLVYGIFNCSALKWLNDKAVAIDLSKRTCLCGEQDGSLMKKGEFFKCRPFKLGQGQAMLHNDMALLLHLASSSNRKTIPYFSVFLFNQWKEKFSQPVAEVCIEAPTKHSLVKLFPKHPSSKSPLLIDISGEKVSSFTDSPPDYPTESFSSSRPSSSDPVSSE